jgi:CP family cyanate transporter-like MFS transporter
MPALAVRLPTLRPIVLLLSAASAVAYVGLAVAPYAGALAWVTLLAVGQTAFPLALAAIGLRARTGPGTVALSAFTQSGGYLLAAFGPLVVGLLYEATGGWLAPLAFLFAALVAQTVAGLAIARPRFIEDEAA